VAAPPAQEKSAKQILDEALDNNALGFQAGQASLSLTIEDKAGERRVRKLDVKSKKIDDATRTLVKLTAPKELRGQSFLFAENTSGEDDVWMYVPAFKVTRRVEGSQKDGSFLGSHFTYADLESRDAKEGKYKRLGDEKIGEHEVYVIETTPADGSDSAYGKVVSYVRKSDSMPLKMRFFDDSGDEAKTLFIEKLDKTDSGDTYVERMTLRPKDGGYTTIEIGSFEGGVELSDSLFSKEQLGK
jgi:outer membrane lipoprotein-sorting protein